MLKFHDNFKEHRKNDIQVRKTKLQKLTRKLCFNNGKLTIYVQVFLEIKHGQSPQFLDDFAE